MAQHTGSSPTARALIELALDAGALRLGNYTLKSGRSSPYFVNFGEIGSAAHAQRLAGLYADELAGSGMAAATLFGAAYKGIPLAALAAAELAGRDSYADVRFAYGRKEPKDHGEGGAIVGKLVDPVVVIDDVITAGTAADLALAALAEAGHPAAALLVAFDRLERARDAQPGAPGALQEIGARHGIKVLSLASARDMIQVLDDRGMQDEAQRIRAHLDAHGGAESG